jgi:hypothetical protein
MKKALTYGTGLIALYLVVANATNFGTAIKGAGGFVETTVKAFQARK